MALEDSEFRKLAILYFSSENNSLSEFSEEIKRVKNIKKQLKKYNSGYNINLRLLLNHMIILNNSFENFSYSVIKFYISDEEVFSKALSLLKFINKFPEDVSDKYDEQFYEKLVISCKDTLRK